MKVLNVFVFETFSQQDLCSKKVVLRGRGDTQVHSLFVFTVLRGPRATRPEGAEIETSMTKSDFFIEFS